MIPREYLSWSSYDLFGRSPKRWKKRYIDGEEYQNARMAFGKRFALMREGKLNSDGFEKVLAFIPDYPKTEHEMRTVIKVDKKPVTLLGIFDGFDPRKKIIADDKTGVKWTQKIADATEQLTFYAFIYWKETGNIPKLRIHWVQTEVMPNGLVVATGKVETFETTRTIQDFIRLNSEINKRWRGIVALCDAEWAKVI